MLVLYPPDHISISSSGIILTYINDYAEKLMNALRKNQRLWFQICLTTPLRHRPPGNLIAILRHNIHQMSTIASLPRITKFCDPQWKSGRFLQWFLTSGITWSITATTVQYAPQEFSYYIYQAFGKDSATIWHRMNPYIKSRPKLNRNSYGQTGYRYVSKWRY